jgi:glycosyltransferase involved in cell wall biosynthesis
MMALQMNSLTKKIREIDHPNIQVINQQNAGLSAARNAGIAVAKGKYIIPLDADNKLHENYFTKAIDMLENDNSVDIVYGNFLCFWKRRANSLF